MKPIREAGWPYAHPKRANWYAARILERPIERREELLEKVPELCRAQTETHIRIADMRATYAG